MSRASSVLWLGALMLVGACAGQGPTPVATSESPAPARLELEVIDPHDIVADVSVEARSGGSDTDPIVVVDSNRSARVNYTGVTCEQAPIVTIGLTNNDITVEVAVGEATAECGDAEAFYAVVIGFREPLGDRAIVASFTHR